MIESADDRVLALPWELIRLDGRVCRSRRPARCRPLRCRSPPTRRAVAADGGRSSLLVNVSAPSGSGLDYERESYLIVRALTASGRGGQRDGRARDLVAGLRGEPPPLGVHFSGHGGRGTLLFEDDYGEGRAVDGGRTAHSDPPAGARAAAALLLSRLLPRRRRAAEQGGAHWRRIGDRAGCTPTASPRWSAISGRCYDELSTRAERAFYASWRAAGGRATPSAPPAAR